MAIWPDTRTLDDIAAMLINPAVTARQICEELGITMYKLTRVLSEHAGHLGSAIEVERQRVVALKKGGRNYNWIVRHTGWPRNTCRRWCDDAGLVKHGGVGRMATPRHDVDLLTSIQRCPVASLLTIPWTAEAIGDWRARHLEMRS